MTNGCCHMLHNNHHLRVQRPDAMQCLPGAEWRGAGGGQMKCHFLNIFRSRTPPSPQPRVPGIQRALTSDSTSL